MISGAVLLPLVLRAAEEYEKAEEADHPNCTTPPTES